MPCLVVIKSKWQLQKGPPFSIRTSESFLPHALLFLRDRVCWLAMDDITLFSLSLSGISPTSSPPLSSQVKRPARWRNENMWFFYHFCYYFRGLHGYWTPFPTSAQIELSIHVDLTICKLLFKKKPQRLLSKHLVWKPQVFDGVSHKKPEDGQ